MKKNTVQNVKIIVLKNLANRTTSKDITARIASRHLLSAIKENQLPDK